MLESNFVFVHGWGTGPLFWDEVREFFPKKTSFYVDLGFLGGQRAEMTSNDAPAIYITHSLGTMWALRHCASQMKALIAINGFSSFKPFSAPRTLETMKRRLMRTPDVQMYEFWDMCGMERGPVSSLDIDRLQEGLDWLGAWDEAGTLNALNIPVLSLAGENDLILPVDTMKKHWRGFSFRAKRGVGHALPQTHPRWCEKEIGEFFRDSGLEI